jgi:hypothetical protein
MFCLLYYSVERKKGHTYTTCLHAPDIYKRIGEMFLDTEDQCTYVITDVCTYTDSSTAGHLFYQYNVVTDADEAQADIVNEYTPCAEMHECDWCQWTNP